MNPIATFLLGLAVGTSFYTFFTTEDHAWQGEAIKYHHAYYHPTTGKFTWKNECVK